MRKTVHKVVAYITDGRQLLVFSHPQFPEAGIQVPAGSVEPGEPTEKAVMREALEETGLPWLRLRVYLGMRDFDASPFGRDEVQRRHFFHIKLEGKAPERWRHFECHPSEGGNEPIEFELSWAGLPDQVPELIAGLGDLLHLVQTPDE